MAPKKPAKKSPKKAPKKSSQEKGASKATAASQASAQAGPPKVSEQEALDFHSSGRPGKLEIVPSKALTTQRDLSLAYSPGVAYPCKHIHSNPDLAYDYTAKGNTVAVISNGTAVLGLGNLGALASKPVMEGKAVLFKKFADIDGVDLEVDTEDVDEFINAVKVLAPSFGGINLEDIAAPKCFEIERRLAELVDIPVFHDDQHGTAIISAAGLFNAMDITGKSLQKIKVVVNGAGAAGIACTSLFKAMGVPANNILLCDRTGVIYKGREKSMNQWKEPHAVETKDRSLEDAVRGSDVLIGLSVKGAFTPEMIKSMNKNPVVFAMANPDPEITPEVVREIRPDAIMATGRSDYPNQVNNVLGFPYIFRGALDVRATTINQDMMVAAADALAQLAREDVPDEVGAAYAGRRLQYGPEYIIPATFDPRLISRIPPAIAEAAVQSGVARKPIEGGADSYRKSLSARLDPTVTHLEIFFEKVRANPKRVVFSEGEQERTIRAALEFRNNGYGEPILVGRENIIHERMGELGLQGSSSLEIVNAATVDERLEFIDMLYERLKRRGYLYRDCQRLVNSGRNVFSACMVKMGLADAMITGITRNYYAALEDIQNVIDPLCDIHSEECVIFGLNLIVSKGRTIFIADTTINELPTAKQLASIAIQSAAKARQLGHEPRVALMSFSTFGFPMKQRNLRIREAVEILDSLNVDFEYDGEMSPDVALDHDFTKSLYPFCRLSGPANVLVMPALHTANISAKLLKQLGDGTSIGPILVGLEKPAQILSMRSTAHDMTTMAAFAAHDAIINTETQANAKGQSGSKSGSKGKDKKGKKKAA